MRSEISHKINAFSTFIENFEPGIIHEISELSSEKFKYDKNFISVIFET